MGVPSPPCQAGCWARRFPRHRTTPLSARQAPGRGAASAFHEFPDSPIDAPAPTPARGVGRARRRPNGHIAAAPYHHMPTLSEHGDIGVRRHSDSDISAEPPALWCAACSQALQEVHGVALPFNHVPDARRCAALRCPGSKLVVHLCSCRPLQTLGSVTRHLIC